MQDEEELPPANYRRGLFFPFKYIDNVCAVKKKSGLKNGENNFALFLIYKLKREL
jgi:hypothetical protein